MRRALSLLILPALATFVLGAGSPAAYAEQMVLSLSDSRLWIEGRSNVNRWSCRAARFSVNATRAHELADPTAPAADSAFDLVVSVDALDCGNARMDRDLKKALSADLHPEIRFTLHRARVVATKPVDTAEIYDLLVHGILEVAGVSRTIEFETEGHRLNDGRARAMGFVGIRMTDFGVDPPRRLLGLIRARDELEVHFDLTAVPERSSSEH